MIHSCVCNHPGQDALHGKGMRVFNSCKPKDKTGWVRCSVCGREIQIGKSEKKEEKKEEEKKK